MLRFINRLHWHFSLLAQFTFLSLIITAAIAGVLAYMLREKLVQNALEEVATTAAEQADRIILPYLTPQDFDGLSPERLTALDARIRSDALGQHIVRVKIWNPRGVLIYRDDGGEIGKPFPMSDELEQALGGTLAMELSALDKPENASEADYGGKGLFEIYVPVRLGSSRVLGAYEIYHDLGIVQTRIDELSGFVYSRVALGFVVLYLSLYLLVRRASHDLVSRSAENAQLFEAEQARRQELTALYELARTLSDTHKVEAVLDVVVRRAVETIHISFARMAVLEDGEFVVRAMHPIRVLDRDLEIGRRVPLAALPYLERFLAQQELVLLHPDTTEFTSTEREVFWLDIAKTLCLVLLRASDHNLGVLMLGEMRGVAREPFTEEKLRLVRAIGDQAASSLHRAFLHEQTVRDAAALALAHDAAIEGWSRALDLRDKETEGHSQRVTEMTLRLARAMCMDEAELVHVRRGALLHDIGKMGIPDSILLKPGPLTSEERSIMRKHPQYAHDLLRPLVYLHPALDIPYCHHEKWDGSGYPRGLKGEAIPLAARIFAVADVWDALLSDRPYRPAWEEERVIEHIHALAGTHFDLRVVETFLQIPKAERLYLRIERVEAGFDRESLSRVAT